MIELGGQVKAVTAATMALRERHQGDVSISVAAAQLLLSGTNGNNAGPEEEEAALSLARDEELMQALSKVRNSNLRVRARAQLQTLYVHRTFFKLNIRLCYKKSTLGLNATDCGLRIKIQYTSASCLYLQDGEASQNLKTQLHTVLWNQVGSPPLRQQQEQKQTGI